MATQLIHSDSSIIFKPYQKGLFRFDPAYTYLTTSAAYPSEINKPDGRNLDYKVSPRVTDYKAAEITWNDEKHWDRTVANGASSALATDTTLTLATGNADVIVKNQILKVASTGEQLVVTGFGSTNQVTVARAQGETAAAAIPAGAKLIVLGTALYDRDHGSEMRAPLETNDFTNYMQTLDVSYEITEGTEYYDFQGGKVLPRITREGAMEAAYNLEDTLTFGEPKVIVDPNNAKNIKQLTCGLVTFLKKFGKIDLDLNGASLTLATMLAFESQFKPDSTKKAVWLCSQKALGAIDMILQSYQRVCSADPVKLAVGMTVKVFHSTLRDIELVHLPALDKEGNDVDIIRYNPAEYMELLATKGGWQYMQVEKDQQITYSKYWLHGTFGAKFHLASDVGGIIRNVANPFTGLTFNTGGDGVNDYILSA